MRDQGEQQRVKNIKIEKYLLMTSYVASDFHLGESGAFLDRGIFGQSTFRPFNVLLEQLYFNLI